MHFRKSSPPRRARASAADHDLGEKSGRARDRHPGRREAEVPGASPGSHGSLSGQATIHRLQRHRGLRMDPRFRGGDEDTKPQ